MCGSYCHLFVYKNAANCKKKNTHCVANRSGGMERSCNYLLRISQNTKKKKSFKKKERKVILNIAIQHRDALILACFVGVALVTGRGGST